MRSAQEGVREGEERSGRAGPLHSTLENSIMKKYATLLAGVLGALTFALPAVAADDAAKASMKQADSTYDMSKKQAKADEKSAKAQCDTKSGDAKSQCNKDAEATYKKTMADAEAAHDKAKADYKAKK
jgi:hypothetical protein